MSEFSLPPAAVLGVDVILRYIVELPDLYCELVLSRKLTLRLAANEYKRVYQEAERALH